MIVDGDAGALGRERARAGRADAAGRARDEHALALEACLHRASVCCSAMAELLAFLGVAAVVICTPGQDTALTIRNALLGGRRSGIATAAGVAAGQAVWTLAAASASSRS